jgi:hypothetical protein
VDLAYQDTPTVTFRALAPVRWETIEVGHLDAVTSLDELEHLAQRAWQIHRDANRSVNDAEWMVRIALTGPCPLWAELRNSEDRDLLATELCDMLGVLDVVVTTAGIHPVIPIEEHRLRTDVLGEVLRLCDSVRQGETTLPKLDRGALVGVTNDDPGALRDYIKSLLGGAEGELAARLLEDTTS